jgi:hypothetical protein
MSWRLGAVDVDAGVVAEAVDGGVVVTAGPAATWRPETISANVRFACA